MSFDSVELTDTSDMYGVHEAFRRGLREAPRQLAAIGDGDVDRTRRFTAYFEELLWLLHTHHSGEDELLYPLLVERAPDDAAQIQHIDAQHATLQSSLHDAVEATKRFGESGSVADGAVLMAACNSLHDELVVHLSDEEREILPIAARCVTPEEWAALPRHAMMQYEGSRIWMPFGLAMEAMPPNVLEQVLTNAPPVATMWNRGGAEAFAAEMAAIRSGASANA